MEFFEGLKVQKNVIYALIQREAITRYDGSMLGYLWAAAEPIFHIAAYLFLFSLIDRADMIPGEHNITVLAMALLPFLLFRRTTLNIMTGIESNLALLSYPHVKPIDIFLSRLILESSVMSTVFILMLLLFNIFDLYSGAISYLEAFFAYIVLLCFSFGVGLIGASIKLFFPSYQEIYSNMMRFVYWTSGIFFIVDDLPQTGQDILFYQPNVHFSEWFRSSLLDNYESDFYDKILIIKISLTVLLLGLTLIFLLEKRIRQMHD